jgi:hypothetical protein
MSTIDNFNSELEQTISELSSFNKILLKNSNTNLILTSNAAKVAAEEEESAEMLKKLKGVTKNATAQFGTFTKSLLNSGSSFEPLAAIVELVSSTMGNFLGIFGPIGAFFGAASEATGAVAAHLIRSMDKAYASFEKMSQNGVVSSFTDMQKAGVSLGMSISEMETLFTKSSKDIALLGGSAGGGRAKLEDLGIHSRETRKRMQRLGISATDFTEFQISALNQRQRYQGTQIKIDDDAVKITENYALELKTLADLTGMSIRQHDEYNKKLMDSAEYVFGIQGRTDLSEPVKKSVTNFLHILNASSPELAKMTLGGLSNFGIGRTQAEKDFFSQMAAAGTDMMNLTKDLTSGKIDEFQAVQKTIDTYKRMVSYAEKTVGVINSDNPLYAVYTQMQKFITEKDGLTKQQYEEQLDKNKKIAAESTGLNTEIADTKTYMRDTSIRMEQLATSSETVATLMNVMSDTMKDFMDELAKMVGKGGPKSLEIQRELNSVQKEIRNLKPPTEKDILESLITNMGTSVDDESKKLLKKYDEKLAELKKQEHNLKIKNYANEIEEKRKNINDFDETTRLQIEEYQKNNPTQPKTSSTTQITPSTAVASTVTSPAAPTAASAVTSSATNSSASTGSTSKPTVAATSVAPKNNLPQSPSATPQSELISDTGFAANTGGIVQNTNESDQSDKGTNVSQRSLPGSLNIATQDNKHIENMSMNLNDKFALLIDLLESSNSMTKKKMQATMA